ncbi:hypothetical protein WJX81_006909 [Elliptochloris bilobata]|uniref:Uncharacterized protein n=1 Tax=Elliptochloris bilobata TaxID=381761 RepID=A0AAW1RU00_9CHLO
MGYKTSVQRPSGAASQLGGRCLRVPTIQGSGKILRNCSKAVSSLEQSAHAQQPPPCLFIGLQLITEVLAGQRRLWTGCHNTSTLNCAIAKPRRHKPRGLRPQARRMWRLACVSRKCSLRWRCCYMECRQLWYAAALASHLRTPA